MCRSGCATATGRTRRPRAPESAGGSADLTRTLYCPRALRRIATAPRVCVWPSPVATSGRRDSPERGLRKRRSGAGGVQNAPVVRSAGESCLRLKRSLRQSASQTPSHHWTPSAWAKRDRRSCCEALAFSGSRAGRTGCPAIQRHRHCPDRPADSPAHIRRNALGQGRSGARSVYHKPIWPCRIPHSAFTRRLRSVKVLLRMWSDGPVLSVVFKGDLI